MKKILVILLISICPAQAADLTILKRAKKIVHIEPMPRASPIPFSIGVTPFSDDKEGKQK